MANSSVTKRMQEIMSKAKAKAYMQVEARMKAAIMTVIDNILYNFEGVESVTGNAITGFAIGAYLDGQLKCVATSEEALGRKAKMQQLRKGERYPYTEAWGGAKMRKPYYGETDTGGGVASQEALRFLNSHKPRQSKGWAYIVVSAADYSKYIETTKKGNLLTATRDLLAAAGAQVSDVKSGK